MARADADEPSNLVTDAVDLLTRDHRLLDELFTSFAQATPQQLDPIARRLCKMARIHTQIEEELFYPAARRALSEANLIDRAEHDHADAKQVVMRVESMTSDHAQFADAVQELRKLLQEHAAWEEQELFPLLRTTRADLVALGLALAERRDTLMDVLGLHGDDEEGAANMREMQRSAQRSAQRDAR